MSGGIPGDRNKGWGRECQRRASGGFQEEVGVPDTPPGENEKVRVRV